MMLNKMKIFKVRSLTDSQKYGIAAVSLKDLIAKGCKRLKLSPFNCRVCLYEDGTEVNEDYLQRVPDNTNLIILTAGQSWNGYISDLEHFLSAFERRQDEVIKAAQNLLTGEQAPMRRKLLQDLIYNLNENISAETREEDSKWFQGIESRFKTKSDYMRYSCEGRIRGYMKEVENYPVEPAVQKAYYSTVEQMSQKLKAIKYNGSYFNRTENDTRRLCTREGWFSCQIVAWWDQGICLYRNCSQILDSELVYVISRGIEKKRTIIPTLVKAVKNRNGKEINWEYFYRILFTVENLKLVHITCHKKTVHNLSCSNKQIYSKRKTPKKRRAAPGGDSIYA
ncbi:DNA fragmentation factor subunit beta [Protopterus annectens]|uniref:DNA fragmentation factor subunit beta n=1 Tax=Protopterus annectens TaxID=7888 RepID=UPI001CFC15EB|nr:DNA fragmentation factor subunit beta [Protopterus annectens]